MIEILDYQETELGLLMLRRRELVSRPGVIATEVTLDHCFLMSSYHTQSEEALASTALKMHPGPGGLDVLVGGLGLGFTAKAALRDDRVNSVNVVEFLPQVIRWIEESWIPDSEIFQDNERVEVNLGDVYHQLLHPNSESRQYDLILIDVDHAPDEMLTAENAPFYTMDGLTSAREHLKEDGVLGIWSTYPNEEFVELLGRAFSSVSVEVVTWWNDLIDEEKEDTLFFARR